MKFILAILISCLFVTPINAQQSQRNPSRMNFSFEGEATLVGGDLTIMGKPRSPAEKGTRLLIKYDGKLTMGLLFGEPVVMVRMKYDVIGGSVTIPTLEPGEEKYETINLDQIPTVARKLIGIYDMKMVFHFATSSSQDVRILEDGGAFMRAGEYSFNVPGSPDWDEVFVVSLGDFTDDGIRYMSAANAQDFWARGLTLVDTEIHDVEISLYDLHNWWAKNNTIPEYAAAMRAVSRVREGMRVSYRYTDIIDYLFEGRPEQELALKLAQKGSIDQNGYGYKYIWGEGHRLRTRDNYFVQFGEARDYALEALEKLRRLPPNIRIGDNHAPFRQSLLDAEQILQETRALRSAFVAEGRNPASLPRGRPQRMEGAYAVSVREDGARVLTEDGTGRDIRELRGDQILIQDSYLVETRQYACSGGSARISGKNPETNETVTEFEVPCSSNEGWLNTLVDQESEQMIGLRFSFDIGARRTFSAPSVKRCSGLRYYTSAETPRQYHDITFDFDIGPSETYIHKERGSVGSVFCLTRRSN